MKTYTDSSPQAKPIRSPETDKVISSVDEISDRISEQISDPPLLARKQIISDIVQEILASQKTEDTPMKNITKTLKKYQETYPWLTRHHITYPLRSKRPPRIRNSRPKRLIATKKDSGNQSDFSSAENAGDEEPATNAKTSNCKEMLLCTKLKSSLKKKAKALLLDLVVDAVREVQRKAKALCSQNSTITDSMIASFLECLSPMELSRQSLSKKN